VPIDKVDPVYFASAYLLGSGDDGAKAYHLLTSAMQKTGRAALAKFVLRGKEHLVLIRPYENLLMLHTMHYADEMVFGQVAQRSRIAPVCGKATEPQSRSKRTTEPNMRRGGCKHQLETEVSHAKPHLGRFGATD
jgi:Ku70/Ku80 beta-barrel domain